MTELTTNLNYISSLPDDPTLTTAQLKAEFDKAGNAIKDYINNTLLDEITSDIASCLASAKSYADTQIGAINLGADNISYDNTASGLSSTKVQGAIDELKSSITSTGNSKTVYGDFVVTSHASGTIDHGHGGDKTTTISATKSGYYPLGIIGFRSTSTNHYNNTPLEAPVKDIYLSAKSSGSCTITCKTYVSNNSAWNYSATVTAYVLWVKVR